MSKITKVVWIYGFCFILIACGCDKKDAVDEAISDLKPEVTYQGKRFSQWGKELEDRDVQKRRLAAKALGEMGKDAIDALPSLEKLLGKSGEDGIVRYLAAVGIWEMTGEVRRVMPALLSMLRNNDPDIRYRAVLVFEYIGPPALAATSALQKIVDDYGKLNYSTLNYDEQLLLATTKDALEKIEGLDE